MLLHMPNEIRNSEKHCPFSPNARQFPRARDARDVRGISPLDDEVSRPDCPECAPVFVDHPACLHLLVVGVILHRIFHEGLQNNFFITDRRHPTELAPELLVEVLSRQQAQSLENRESAVAPQRVTPETQKCVQFLPLDHQMLQRLFQLASVRLLQQRPGSVQLLVRPVRKRPRVECQHLVEALGLHRLRRVEGRPVQHFGVDVVRLHRESCRYKRRLPTIQCEWPSLGIGAVVEGRLRPERRGDSEVSGLVLRARAHLVEAVQEKVDFPQLAVELLQNFVQVPEVFLALAARRAYYVQVDDVGQQLECDPLLQTRRHENFELVRGYVQFVEGGRARVILRRVLQILLSQVALGDRRPLLQRPFTAEVLLRVLCG